MSRGGDVFVCDYDTRVRLLARNNTPLDAERQRGLLGDRIFPRGDSIKDSEGARGGRLASRGLRRAAGKGWHVFKARVGQDSPRAPPTATRNCLSGAVDTVTETAVPNDPPTAD